MRKIYLLLTFLFVFSGCSISDQDQEPVILYELAPIKSVDIPLTFEKGKSYPIKITYTNPSPCTKFAGYDHLSEDQIQYFGIITSYDPGDPLCTEEEGSTEEYVWDLTVFRNDLYIFKFWQGADEDGEPIYLTKEVTVIE